MALNDHAAILQAVTNCVDGYIWCMGKGLELLYMSDKTREMIAQIYGASFEPGERLLEKYALFDPQSAEEWRRLYQLALDGTPQQITRQYNFAGRAVIAEITIKPFYLEDNFVCLVCSARELYDDERSHRKLEVLETRFRALTENSLEGMAFMNEREELTYVSPSVKRILGLAPEEMLGPFKWEEIDPEDQVALKGSLREIARSYGQSFEGLTRVKHKSGEWRWMFCRLTNWLHDPAIHSIVLNFTDFTDRINHAIAAENSEQLYQSLFNTMPSPIWVCSRKDLAFLEVNETAVRSFGYSREEFLQMTAFDLRSEGNRDDLIRVVREGNSEPLRNKLRRHLKKNGEIAFVELVVEPIVYKGNEAYLMIASDISNTLRLQHTLMKERVGRQVAITRATIETQEKDRELVGKELHDNVNQMLATVKLYLAAHGSVPHMDKELLGKSRAIIDESIEEIRRISRSMVPPSLGEVSLKDSIEELTVLIPLARKRIYLCLEQLKEEFISDPLKISLYRIIQEQVNNIIKHSEADNIYIRILQTESRLDLRIADDGKGFDTTLRRKGIGLTNIINRTLTFNGRAVVDSSPGNGCRLHVCFSLRE
ncbi:PAS domain S-box protein [Nostoc ellipsosporum NOK]|nr:PAS domain S-box protein [Nostoc ellipsosporum NOK]